MIDFDGLRLHKPEVWYDLPAGGRRLMQRVDGYKATFVAGRAGLREWRAHRRAAGQAGARAGAEGWKGSITPILMAGA